MMNERMTSSHQGMLSLKRDAIGERAGRLFGRVEDCPGLLDPARVVQVQNVDDSPAPALLLCLEESNAMVIADQNIVDVPGGLYLLVLLLDLIKDRGLASKLAVAH